MKKIICIMLTLTLAASFVGCAKKDTASKKTQTSTTGVNDILNNSTTAPAQSASAPAAESNIPVNSGLKTKSSDGIDFDLTNLNANMIYSQLYDMMTKPDEYEGKKIKLSGTFYTYEDPATSKLYFSCFVADAAACCQQGLEFELTDDYQYPSDYPDENAPITVSGIFETYKEGENLYCHLKDAVFAA